MDRPQFRHQHALVTMFRDLGVSVTLSITGDEVQTLTPDDLDALRELGATDAMLADLRALAAVSPGRILAIDFDRGTVVIEK